MARSWYSIKAASPDRAEVSIFDEIGIWGVNARDFIAQFKAIAAPNVDLYINSPGGDVMQALAMLNAMTQSGKDITVTVMGVAASAASYLVLAGTKRVMPDNTYQFLHDPLTGIYGDAEDLRAAADVLDKVRDGLVSTYVKRSGQTPEAIKALLAGDTLMSAQECLDAGLADEVAPAIQIAAKFDAERPDLPEVVRAIFAKAAPAPKADTPFATRVQALAAAAGVGEFASVFALDESLATIEAVQQAIAEAAEVHALCVVLGQPELAGPQIKARASLAEARRAIQAQLADADADTAIDTARRVQQPAAKAAPTEFSATRFWAERNQRSIA